MRPREETGQTPPYDRICITFDIDWAKDEIVQPIVDRMERSRIKATFFATHRSQLLASLNSGQFEVGLHPNFNEANGDFRSPIRSLKSVYPHAKGTRSHSLFVSSHILQLQLEHGLRYESNNFLPLHEGLHPVMRFEEFVSIPFYWSDDKHLVLSSSFGLPSLNLRQAGLKVFNFHPIHVLMNTSSEKHYQTFKSHYGSPSDLVRFKNVKSEGIGTLFEALLDYIQDSGSITYRLDEICEEYLDDQRNA